MLLQTLRRKLYVFHTLYNYATTNPAQKTDVAPLWSFVYQMSKIEQKLSEYTDTSDFSGSWLFKMM